MQTASQFSSLRVQAMGLSMGIAFAIGAISLASAQVVPGYTVELYANVTDPVKLAFNNSGFLFSGRDNTGSGGGGGDDVKIHRIGPGGSPVIEYGNSAIHDPDVVLVDHTGAISGVAGTVLVAGGTSDNSGDPGQIVGIFPDQSVSVVIGPTNLCHNPGDMEYLSDGSIIITDLESNNICRIVGNTISVLFTKTQGSLGLAIDSANNIYTNGLNGVIEKRDQFGNLINANFTSGLAFNADMTFGNGILGSDMLAMSNGNLIRIDSGGNQTVIGTGFSTVSSLVYGADGYLYISDFYTDRVLRITPEPGTMAALGIGLAALIARRKKRR